MSFLRIRSVAVLFSALVLGACNSGDRSTRSPELPADTLNSIAMNCTPTTIAVGQTASCTTQCTYNQVQSDGSVVVTPPAPCEGVTFISDDPGIVSVDGDGNYTGVAPGGPTDINGCVDDSCAEVPITVVNPTLNSIDAQCTDTTLVVGQTTQCTAVCTYLFPGNPTPQTLDCINLTWDSGNDAVVTINDNGDATGTGAGTTPVTATVPGGSDSVEINVAPVAASCSIVYPRGVVADPVPNATCSGATPFAHSAPVGTTVPFRAAVRLNNGALCYAPDAPVGQQVCPATVPPITFDSNNDPVATFADPADGNADTVSAGTAAITATASVNQVNLTVTAPVLNATFCVESVARASVPVDGCANIGAAAPAQCVASATPTITTGTTRQFFAYAFFDIGTAQAQVCDVTHADNAPVAVNNWLTPIPPADRGSNAAANPDVSNVEPSKGLVSGGAQATTGATVRAAYTNGGTTVNGSALFNVVASQVIANNSMIASATLLNNTPGSANFAEPTRAACVGSFDLVDGLAAPPGLPAEKRFFGVLRRCPSTALQPDGSCDPAELSNNLEDVSNAEPGNNLPNGTVTWTATPGYWDGNQCVAPTDPTGMAEVVGLVGDENASLPLPARYTAGAAFTGVGDSRRFTEADNGTAVSTGALSLGTVCVETTYTEGLAQDSDGITLIVLPVTNDSLLTDPDATEAVELCNSLVPLFNLGASPEGANGLVVQAVAAVGSILNPLLGGLDAGLNVTSLLATVVTTLTPITGPLSALLLTPILEAANEGVYAPLNCVIGQVLNFLNTQTPGDILACAV
jgi:hypothetical protein